MTTKTWSLLHLVAGKSIAAALVGAVGVGGWLLLAQNRFEKPSTVIHMVTVRWKQEATEAQKRKAIAGIEEMAAKIPGIKRIWLQPLRVQPEQVNGQPFNEGFNRENPYQGRVHCYFIEFESRQAEGTYAKHPERQKWYDQHYDTIREISVSNQATN